MNLSLKSGSRLYLNGAVIKVDRKVNLELMNDAVFILDSHVMQAAQATTPLRQLYFVVQTLLMDPSGEEQAMGLLRQMFASLAKAFDNRDIHQSLIRIEDLVAQRRTFEAIKLIRGLFPIEDAILADHSSEAA